MIEQWRGVWGDPLLEASSLGRVRSRPYRTTMPNGGDKINAMAPTRGVISRADKKAKHTRRVITFRRRQYKVARLVCLAFHGPPPPGKPYVLHRDEDSENNRPANLFWGTQKENLNAPGFIEYCKARTGDNSPVIKGRARRRDRQKAAGA